MATRKKSTKAKAAPRKGTPPDKKAAGAKKRPSLKKAPPPKPSIEAEGTAKSATSTKNARTGKRKK